jgi:hypothetical protein
MTQYAYQQDAFMVGTLHNSTPTRSYTFTAGADLAPGVALKRDLTDSNKLIPWRNDGLYANTSFAAILPRSATLFSRYLENEYTYKVGQKVPGHVECTISVITSVDVKGGDPLYCVAATGEFTNVSEGNGQQLGSFEKDATAGSIVKIHINKL